MRVMAFGPHPDDCELLCSGTLLKYKKQGHEVAVAVMTRGDKGSATLRRDEIAATREKEARAASAILGAEFFWMGYEDEFLYDTPEVRREVIEVIRAFRPDIILCPDKDKDYHPDHTRTGQIIWDVHVMGTIPLIATKNKPCQKIYDIWFYDTYSGVGFDPEVYIDITDTWLTKAKMIDCHVSQNAWMTHLYGVTLTDNAEAQARLRGFQVGCKYAECFRRPKMFPQSAPRDGLLPP